MNYIYIDESGDLGDSYSSTKNFVMGAIVVDSPDSLKKIIKKVKRDINNPNNCPISIMHGDSINYKGLQIADLISWSVFQKVEHQNSKFIDLIGNKKIFEVYKN